MMQDCASSNKIKENKYKILRMSLLLGSEEDRGETINNFEDAAREIDAMNDEVYLKDLEDKFYDTIKLEEEEKKLAVLVDYIGGRVEQRISLLSDFANVTGFDLTNLPPIKYYDKLDDYKERLKYIREYLQNTEQINSLTHEIESAEAKLKEAYLNKANSEEYNSRNEEIILNKFKSIINKLEDYKKINEENIDSQLNKIIDLVQESKKSLDIFTKSFTTLSGSGISYEEEQEYRSYVENAKEVYYANKEQEYLLRIYKYLLKKENEYSQILIKREAIDNILCERLNLRQELNIEDTDILNNIYELLERQYEDIKHQKDNINNIEILTQTITMKKEQVEELEQDNQKVEILSLLREFCMIDTYNEVETQPEVDLTPVDQLTEGETITQEETSTEDTTSPTSFTITQPTTQIPANNDIFGDNSKEEVQSASVAPPKDNQVVSVEKATNIDLELIHSKASKVMKRVGEMLGIKPVETKIVSVENTPKPQKDIPTPAQSAPTMSPTQEENPFFNNEVKTAEPKPEPISTTTDPDNFWFPSDTPDALNELPDLAISNDDFFANNKIPDLNFPDLKIDFGNNESEEIK